MKVIQQTVLYEQAMDPGFLDEVYGIPGGDRVKDCIQCGTCSGSCPVSWAMQETPRQIFAMIRAGMREQVLDTVTIWTCASCYQCARRCPQQIKITDVMYMLKRMAIREKRRKSKQSRTLSEYFVDIVNKYGRNHETELMMKYMLATDPLGALPATPIAMQLYTHGRLPVSGQRIRDIEGLRKIVRKAQELGGE